MTNPQTTKKKKKRILSLAALISCSFGTGSLQWSVNNLLEPVSIRIKEQELLVLAQKRMSENENDEDDASAKGANGRKAWCIQLGCTGITGRDIVLIDPESHGVFGKVPDFKRRSLESDEDYRRVRNLYGSMNIALDDPVVASDRVSIY